MPDPDWAIKFAREYRQENRAAAALHALADTVLDLRAEVRVLRELLIEFRQGTEKTP